MDMMTKSESMEYYEENGVKAVRLPYGKDKSVSMTLILPAENTDIDAFIQEMNVSKWNEIREGLIERNEVRLQIPKFKMEYGIKELEAALTELGMGEAFSDQADFSGIADARLAIGTVKHKAVIDVHEEGSEAAGVTVVGIRLTSVNIDMPQFIADRPLSSSSPMIRTTTFCLWEKWCNKSLITYYSIFYNLKAYLKDGAKRSVRAGLPRKTIRIMEAREQCNETMVQVEIRCIPVYRISV